MQGPKHRHHESTSRATTAGWRDHCPNRRKHTLAYPNQQWDCIIHGSQSCCSDKAWCASTNGNFVQLWLMLTISDKIQFCVSTLPVLDLHYY